jgi:hypothetical protein
MMKRARHETIFGDSFEMSGISQSAYDVLFDFERILRANLDDFRQSDKVVKLGKKGFCNVKFYLGRYVRRNRLLQGYSHFLIDESPKFIQIDAQNLAHNTDYLSLRVEYKAAPVDWRVEQKKQLAAWDNERRSRMCREVYLNTLA